MDTRSDNAFPIPGLQDDENFNGLTKRDYFAAKALQGYLANPLEGPVFDNPEDLKKHIATVSYQYADAMMEARDLSSTTQGETA